MTDLFNRKRTSTAVARRPPRSTSRPATEVGSSRGCEQTCRIRWRTIRQLSWAPTRLPNLKPTKEKFTSNNSNYYFLNGPPRPLFDYFRSFQTNQNNLYNNSMWKMSCPSSLRHQDSNPQHESSPITTWPGPPPFVMYQEVYFHPALRYPCNEG